MLHRLICLSFCCATYVHNACHMSSSSCLYRWLSVINLPVFVVVVAVSAAVAKLLLIQTLLLLLAVCWCSQWSAWCCCICKHQAMSSAMLSVTALSVAIFSSTVQQRCLCSDRLGHPLSINHCSSSLWPLRCAASRALYDHGHFSVNKYSPDVYHCYKQSISKVIHMQQQR